MRLLGAFSLLLCVCAVFGEFKLTILHTNDVHARVEQGSKYAARCSASDASENKCYGGVARRKTEVDRIRRENQNVLLLDGGDQFQGTTWFVVYTGLEAAHFMKRIGYDAMAIGNHEFDRGPAILGHFVKNVTFPVLASNLDVSKDKHLGGQVQKSTVIEKSGVKIGIIGYTFKDTPFISSPGKDIIFNDEVESVKTEARRLTSQGVKIIIALGHSGFEKDQEIARQVPEVDIVVGGHTNTFLYTGPAPSNEEPQGPYPFIVTQPSGKKVPVVQDFAFGKYLGYLQTVFDDNGNLLSSAGNPIMLNGSIQRDPALQREMEQWKVKVDEYGEHKVGTSYVYLNAARATCRLNECNIGNLVTDAMVKMALHPPEKGEWTKVAAAIHNAGGFRASMPKGEILRNDVVATLPFRNTLTQVELKGSDLIRVFEYSVEGLGTDRLTGRFLQVSGIKVKFDLSKPKWNRVQSLEILCHKCEDPVFAPVEKNKIYPILTNSFLRSGGDGYKVLQDAAMNELEIGYTVSDMVAEYITKYSPITHHTEGRIQIINGTQEEQIPVTQPPCINNANKIINSPVLIFIALFELVYFLLNNYF